MPQPRPKPLEGVRVIELGDPDCKTLLADYIRANPDVWHEDIGED